MCRAEIKTLRLREIKLYAIYSHLNLLFAAYGGGRFVYSY